MADIILASVLLIGGLIWSLVCYLALAHAPIPSRKSIGLIVYAGPVAFVAGLVWWVLMIARWLA